MDLTHCLEKETEGEKEEERKDRERADKTNEKILTIDDFG